ASTLLRIRSLHDALPIWGPGRGNWRQAGTRRKYRIAAMSGPFPLYDNAALRRAEVRAASELGDDFVLMQRAGLAAWRCVLAHWPQAQRIAVACGPGNNGGDGYVLARHAREAGRQVRVLRLPGHAPRGEVANRAERAYRDADGRVEEFDGSIGHVDLVVDALFGIGLTRAPDTEAAALVAAIE